jgi:NAD(P)-dependent dehydrogenase (short-subunit alcohol dehydrogenase family)
VTGRVVLVVGASSGIGAATVGALCAAGDSVVAVARSSDGLARLAEQNPAAQTVAADVLDADALARVVAELVAAHGRLDAVVHTAQVMAYGRIEDVPAATFEHVVDTAIHGTANLARAVLPQLRSQGRGTFVIVNSLLGQIATPQMGAYDVGKWGQLGLARVLRLELRDVPGVHVCTVSPGAINTPIYDQAANYAGRGGFPPPPVLPAERAAASIMRLLDHPRRHVNVGPLNIPTELGFRYAPWLYERIVGPLVTRFVFRGARSADNDGNVFAPVPRAEGVHGRWSWSGRAS